MNIIIGQVARDKQFYKREKIIKKLWRAIESGANIQMSAPRRIGKTSLMCHCMDNPKENYEIVYLITESINNKNDFFKKLVGETYKKLSNTRQAINFVANLIQSTQIKSIGPEGITIENTNTLDYYNEFINIIEHIDLQENKLILMIDEFAQTVVNIQENEGELAAVHFLESVREIRIHPTVSEKVQFIFAGSIGLESVVTQLNAVSAINDLKPFTVPPFSATEATNYIQQHFNYRKSYTFGPDEVQYLLAKLNWLSPYYLNIILNEINETCEDEELSVVTSRVIDLAFTNALEERVFFKHWENRLKNAFKGVEYKFAKKILNYTATHSTITKPEIVNLAVEFDFLDSYSETIHTLKTDGYINNLIDPAKYVFNSPLIKQWWFNNVTN